MIERNGRNGERQGLNKRDLFIRQRIPKLFARAELCATEREGARASERASQERKKGRRSEKATANSPARDILSGLHPRPFPPSVGPASLPLFILVILSHAPEREREREHTSQTSVR